MVKLVLDKAARLTIKVHPHILRHACGYALANAGHGLLALQAYLGHCRRDGSRIFGETNSFHKRRAVMEKRGPKGPRITAPADALETDPPTDKELEHLWQQLMRWRCTPAGRTMPKELFVRLEQLIVYLRIQRPWSRQYIKVVRWKVVREGRDRGLSLEKACEEATRALEMSPAQADLEMMRKTYYAVEWTLPPEQRQAELKGTERPGDKGVRAFALAVLQAKPAG
jgi:hypothetical protein